ncbi:MAG: hypothetical protein QOE14_1506, partial [Humisphaera sp.]|nr:hypothetical protein [Humisphaera sp.]
MKSVLVAALALFLVAAAPAPHQHHDEPPVGGVVSVDVCVDGARLHLLTAARARARATSEQPVRLSYQFSDDGGVTFSPAVELGAQQPATIAKRGMDAQIAAAGNHLLAVWPTAGSDKMGRGPMATAISSDGGRTWQAAGNPADDDLTIGHSFIDVAADAAGRFHLVWLDSREGNSKGLRYARSADGGATWSRNQTLDSDCCECCWNTIQTTDGVAVLYRDNGPRDMAMIRSADGGDSWSASTPVGRFRWDITACPHVGGALCVAAGAVHALVWTAKDQKTHGVYALNSADGGATFDSPRRVGQAGGSHPDLCATPDGRLIATWDADGGDGARRGIFIARSADGGRTWSEPRRMSDPAMFATHPRVVRTA